MYEDVVVNINGKGLHLLKLDKHNFSLRESLELLCRLFNYKKVHAMSGCDINLEENALDYTTKTKFDYNWLKDGIYNIDDLTDDEETRNVIKNGYSLFMKNITSVNIKNKSKDKLISTFNEYKENIIKRIKETKPDITKEKLNKIICSLNEKFDNEDTINDILKELEDCDIDTVTCNDLVKGFKTAVNNLVSEQQPVAFHQISQRPIIPMPVMYQRSVADIVNFNTKPSNISPEANARLSTRLYNALSNQEAYEIIYKTQTTPLFVFIEYNHEYDFIIQSCQPGFNTITIHITENQIRFMN